MTHDDSSELEERARLAARRLGLTVRKGPLRKSSGRPDRGGFMLINERSNFIVAGQHFDLSAEAVIECCDHIQDGTAPSQGWR